MIHDIQAILATGLQVFLLLSSSADLWSDMTCKKASVNGVHNFDINPVEMLQDTTKTLKVKWLKGTDL